MNIIHNTDALQWADSYQGELFHAMLCDPPYHLSDMTKRFGGKNAAPAKGGVYNRSGRGFMGQTWDGGDLVFQPETWQRLTRVLYPGAFIFAFASAKGMHRMAVAMEDSGLILHPTIMVWCYGSGFPKATRIDTQIDKAQGIQQTPDADHPYLDRRPNPQSGITSKGLGAGKNMTKPVSPLAQAWAGHRYGGQALKPAFEPIIVAQVPYPARYRPVDSITLTGAGALNIDLARIKTGDTHKRRGGLTPAHEGYQRPNASMYTHKNDYEMDKRGRWAANIILQHTPECTDSDCASDCPVLALDSQTEFAGGDKRDGYKPPHGRGKTAVLGDYGDKPTVHTSYPESGTATRYFYKADWMHERLESADNLIYEGKATTAERESGLHNFSTNESGRRNIHPTVKPISLTRHLAELLLPPDIYAPRRLFVPFAGVGSEMIGAALAGWEHIEGVEMTAEYIPIAEKRLAYWCSQNDPTADKILPDGSKQLSLYGLLKGNANEPE